MTTLVVVYRGRSVGDLEVVGASADPRLVRYVSGEMLRGEYRKPEPDPALAPIQRGRRRALEVLADEPA